MNVSFSFRSLTLKTSFLFFAILLLIAFECKQLYIKIKKDNRYVYYNEYADEVKGTANRIEAVDNKSYIYVLRLNKLLGTVLKANVSNDGAM